MNEQEQIQMLQRAVFGFIGYAASQNQEIPVEQAAAQVAQLAQSNPELLQEIASNEDLVNAGILVVEQKQPEAAQAMQDPELFMQLMQASALSVQELKALMAKRGAKLQYLNSLKAKCPEGYETVYMKAGGSVCPVCKKKAEKAKKAACGTKMKKTGAVSKAMEGVKADMAKCGKKVVKDLLPALPLTINNRKLGLVDYINKIKNSTYVLPNSNNASYSKTEIPENGYTLEEIDYNNMPTLLRDSRMQLLHYNGRDSVFTMPNGDEIRQGNPNFNKAARYWNSTKNKINN